MTEQLPEIVFVLGGPGAGKGTQCARIVSEFGYVHLSAGDLLRAERTKGGTLGNMIADYIKDGKIIPVEITIRLIKEAMEANVQEGRTKFLIDGFPRNEDNLKGWQQQMTGKCHINFLLFLDCPEKVMEGRLLGRQEGRADDNIESIRKRFNTYVESTMPIIKQFEAEGLVRRIVADATPDEVFKAVSVLFASVKAVPKQNTPDESDQVKKNFGTLLSQSVRDASKGDPEAGAASKDKKMTQFWDMPVEKQQEIVKACVQKAVFNPSPTDEGSPVVTWSIKRASYLSVSGGFYVYATEKKTGGKQVQHQCRVNAYGVLENYSTPTHPKTSQAPDEGGCVVC